jgi:branched-chain amino acid transport system permease protein
MRRPSFVLKSVRSSFVLTSVVVALLLAVPLSNTYNIRFFIISFIWIGVTVSWNVLIGYAGIFSFGQIAIFSIGSYTYTITLLKYNIPPWIALFLGGSVACLAGFFIGLLTLRLRSIYLALFTFSFHQLLSLGVNHYVEITGGQFGLLIPQFDTYQFSIGPLILSASNMRLYYYLTFLMLLISVVPIYKMLHSKIGLALRAIRDDSKVAQSLGVNIYYVKLLVFSVTSFFTGLMGAYYSNYFGYVSSGILSFDFLIMVLAMLYLGGVGHFQGPMIGAIIVSFISLYLSDLGYWRYIILGTVIILVVLLAPGGLGQIYDRISKNLMKHET